MHPLLICGGIQWSVDIGAMLIFSPVVNVANETEWWKFEPIDNDFFTFYQKHEIINHIMNNLNFHDYMVIPIIVKNKKCQAIDSFLPDSENRSWLFIHGINSDPDVFNQFRYENIFSVDKDTIPIDVYFDVYTSIFNLYKQRNYYNKSFNNKMFL